jgi:hypothetical protein
VSVPNKIYLYRIIHINNLDYILKLGKLTCPNHYEKDPNYIGIGDITLIPKRSKKQIDLSPNGTFQDYISFYFCNRSPMLYVIAHGYNGVIKRDQEDIIYLVTDFNKIKDEGLQYIFFDGHGFDGLSLCYNNEKDLIKIDWKAVQTKDWKKTEFDQDIKRKKQAELLVYSEFPLSSLKGIACYNQIAHKKIESLLLTNNLSIKSKIIENWYY